jgi:hypothetical protein
MPLEAEHRWPSGLRRYVQVVFSLEAWVQIPLDALHFCGPIRIAAKAMPPLHH